VRVALTPMTATVPRLFKTPLGVKPPADAPLDSESDGDFGRDDEGVDEEGLVDAENMFADD